MIIRALFSRWDTTNLAFLFKVDYLIYIVGMLSEIKYLFERWSIFNNVRRMEGLVKVTEVIRESQLRWYRCVENGSWEGFGRSPLKEEDRVKDKELDGDKRWKMIQREQVWQTIMPFNLIEGIEEGTSRNGLFKVARTLFCY